MKQASGSSEDLKCYLHLIAVDPAKVNAHRLKQLKYWQGRSAELLEASRKEIMEILDEDLRRLYLHKKGNSKTTPLFHCALFREMARAAGASDESIIDELIQGMFITGDIRRSHVWAPKLVPAELTVEQWEDEACEERKVLVQQIQSSVSDSKV